MVITATKKAAAAIVVGWNTVPTSLKAADAVTQEIPFVGEVLDVITAGYVLYSLMKDKPIVLAKYPVGTVLPTPTTKPGDFTKKKNGQGWVRNKTGEIYKKSNTSHGNPGNTGDQWKVWPEGTNDGDMGSNSKKTGERTTLDQNGKVIGS